MQPGVVLDVLNAQLAPLGRRLGPDPDRLGGMHDRRDDRHRRQPARGRSGYGTTGDHVERASASSSPMARSTSWATSAGPASTTSRADFKDVVVRSSARLVRRSGETIARQGPQVGAEPRRLRSEAARPRARASTWRGSWRARKGRSPWSPRRRLRTVPIPARAGRGDPAVRPDWRCRGGRAGLSRRADPRSATSTTGGRSAWSATPLPAFRDWIAEAAEAVLIVEFEGDDPDEVARRVRHLSPTGSPGPAGSSLSRSRSCAAPTASGWLGLRRVLEPLLMRMRGRARPVPLFEDVAVPPEALAEFLQRLQNILKAARRELDARRARRARPVAHPSIPRPGRPARRGQARADGGSGLRGGTGARRDDLGRARLRPGSAPSSSAASSASWSRSSARSRTRSTRSTCSTPARSSATIPHLMTRDLRRLPCRRRPRPPSSRRRSGAARARAGAGAADRAGLPPPILRWTDRVARSRRPLACNGCGVCRTREPTLRMCPTLPCLGARGRHAPRPGQPDPPARRRHDRSQALGHRGVQGQRRPLHPLQPLHRRNAPPVSMSRA